MSWSDLIQAYASAKIDQTTLKTITLSQWALESKFGQSELALKYNNLSGLKFRNRINIGLDSPIAHPVDYDAHDGEDVYCRFENLDDFITGYWRFIETGETYKGWQDFGNDPLGFIEHLHKGGFAEDSKYVDKITALLPRIRQQIEDAGQKEAFADPTEGQEVRRIAILIGHNEKSQGAYSKHLDVSEWIYNQRVARYLQIHQDEFQIEVKKFFRKHHDNGYQQEISEAYAAIDNWNPELIVELHFNAGGGRGSEMLYWHTSTRGKKLATSIQLAVVNELALKSRGVKPVTDGARGATSLKASKAPTIITEPFFGDSKKDSKLMRQVGPEALARSYLIGMRDYLTSQ